MKKKSVSKKTPEFKKIDKVSSIDISGGDPSIWRTLQKKFNIRILSILKNITEKKLTQRTIGEDLESSIENLIVGSQAILERPQLINLEKQASIKAKLAEARKIEAEARLINAQADEKELDLENRKIMQSSRDRIELAIQRGDLLPVEKDGQLYFIYNPKSIEEKHDVNVKVLSQYKTTL